MNYTKIILYVIIGIIIIVVLSAIVKNISILSSRIGGMFKPYQGDFSDPVTAEDKTHLRNLATELNSAIYSAGSFGVTDIISKINDLNDSDFLFLCNYYNQYFENKICEDIDNEWLPFSSEDENFLSRYNGTGLTC